MEKPLLRYLKGRFRNMPAVDFYKYYKGFIEKGCKVATVDLKKDTIFMISI